MLSTWWFMSPLQKIGVDPCQYEAGVTARFFVRNFGVRIGLVLNGLIELFAVAAILTAAVLSSAYFLKVDVALSALFWNSIALTYFALIIRSNYEFGKKSREMLVKL